MRIGGLQEFSLIDYPGKVACIVFTQGCNFRCGYCHNPELVIPSQFSQTIPEEQVFNFLQNRQKYLQGVVVSGGEPTLQKDLAVFLGKIKRLGYLIKLDTNGSYPDRLEQLIHLKLVDYIAMDVKTSLGRYQEMVGVQVDVEKIKASIDLIIHSGLQHEFRTTVVKPFCSYDDLSKVRDMTQGSQRHRLQKIRLDDKLLDKRILTQSQYSECEFSHLEHIFQMNQSHEREELL
ncbi:MAG: anaerobic ribonucleoside-triphosphate reductase activating protein [Candidatus Omnitrophica bacterium]|nr:anaerobic ribonucleoside-triphosphate reductase activating protein [Candidatus Omnitrophota bacterium]